ncbi:efflux transporter outer membrane subunit [Cruoricaptor ignavus]|uniref:efflux transporter outer membrane subunit n=1 Tax=Cruoricaptor ignavus TaxID=1118202 RepID=UPI00370D1E8A
MLNNQYFRIFTAVFFAMVMNSCAIRENYERPANIAEAHLYRTDQLPKDSLGAAQLSWREFFTDDILRNHIAQALQNNQDIRIAEQNIVQAEAYLNQSKAAYAPTISAGADYTLSTASLNSQLSRQMGLGRKYNDMFGLAANLGWEVDIFGRIRSLEKAQQAQYFAVVSAHSRVKSTLVASLASAYYHLLALDEQKRVINETIAIRRKNLATTRALKEAGILTEVAVQQSEALVFSAESLLINVDLQIFQLENTFNLLKGEPGKRVERGTLDAQNPPGQISAGYPAAMLSHRPDVMQAEFNLINAYELRNAAKAAFYPTLRLTGTGGIQSSQFDDFFSVNSLFGNLTAGLTAPIFQRRQIRTQYEVAVAEREKALLNFRKTVLQAGKEVSDAIKTYEMQDPIIALKRQEAENYRRSVEYSQELVNYGMANYLEVLNATVNSLNAELSIANAKFSKLNASVELYRALGGGWK